MAITSGSISGVARDLEGRFWWWLLGSLALANSAASQQVPAPSLRLLDEDGVHDEARRIYIKDSDTLVSGKRGFHVTVKSYGFGGKGAWLRITDTRDNEPGMHHEPDRDLHLGTFHDGEDAFVVDIPKLKFIPTEFRVYCADYIECRSGELPYVNCIYPFARSTHIPGLLDSAMETTSRTTNVMGNNMPGVLVVLLVATGLGCLAVLGWKCQASKQLRDLTFSKEGLGAESGAEVE